MAMDSAELTHTQKIAVSVIAGLLAAWIGWVSWELYTFKAADKMHSALAVLTTGINNVDRKLDVEIERSKIKDDVQHNWLKEVSDRTKSNRERLIRLER